MKEILDGLCLRKIILKCLDYFVSPHIDGSSPHTLSTQMFPNLDHFVWELSVSKTSASPCVGIENPLFITLDLPSPFSQMSSHDVENTLRKMNQLEFRLGKVRKSTLIQSLKFLSFLTDVTTTGIESPTAAKMSQPKTISHKVFPIPHYLTTWPSDYLTIWRLFDYLVTGWRELELCKARVGSREGGHPDYPDDWLTPCLHCTLSLVLLYFCTSDHFRRKGRRALRLSNYLDDWRRRVNVWLSAILNDGPECCYKVQEYYK